MLESRHGEYLHSLPADWEQVAVGNLGMVVAGGTPSRTQPSFWGGAIPWVTPGEITRLSDKRLRATAEGITPRGVAGSAATLLPPGTLLVTTRATIGALAIAGVPVTTNQGFKNILPGPTADPDFFYYVLQRVAPELRRLASGSTFDEIPKREFEAVVLPLPPLPEQRRIAEVLDTADEAIRQTEAIIAKLKQMKQGLLHDLLTRGLDENGELRDPVAHPEQFKDSPLGRIPRGWAVQPIGNLLAGVVPAMRSGPFGSELLASELMSEGVPLLGIDNVYPERFVAEYTRFVSRSKNLLLRRYAVRPHDVMVTIMGTVGRSCLVPEGIGEALSSKHVWTLTFDQTRYSPSLASLQINYAPWVLAHFRRDEQGGIMSAIRSDTLRQTLLPVPPLQEQSRILDAISADDLRVRAEEAYRDKLRLLKRGLMQDLLTGRVRVPAPEGDPEMLASAV